MWLTRQTKITVSPVTSDPKGPADSKNYFAVAGAALRRDKLPAGASNPLLISCCCTVLYDSAYNHRASM